MTTKKKDIKLGDKVLIVNHEYGIFNGEIGIVVTLVGHDHYPEGECIGVDFGKTINEFSKYSNSVFPGLWQLRGEGHEYLLKRPTGRYFEINDLVVVTPEDVGDLEDDY